MAGYQQSYAAVKTRGKFIIHEKTNQLGRAYLAAPLAGRDQNAPRERGRLNKLGNTLVGERDAAKIVSDQGDLAQPAI